MRKITFSWLKVPIHMPPIVQLVHKYTCFTAM
jgi:hypothetical protein